eukprot:15364660-Ditylum_brightwellii.AAC.3
MDYPWVNDVLIEKSEIDTPVNWPEFCYRPAFNKKGKYEGHKLSMGGKPVTFMTKGSKFIMEGNFIMMDGKMKKAQEMDQQEVIYSLQQARGR